MNHTINLRGKLFSLAEPQVMGILNVTPDSFFAPSRKNTEDDIAVRANEIVTQGGTMIDIGACSTRPGSDPVSEEEEGRRLQMALEAVRSVQPDIPVSVDTFRPRLARRCIEEWGADIVNDVYPSEEMFRTVADLQVPYIVMSSQSNMHDMLLELSAWVQQLHALGVADVITDPGFGFGKTLEQNYEVLHDLKALLTLDCPMLVGVSRKRMIYQLLESDATQALNGTTVINTLSLLQGASILRVHDVREAAEAVQIVKAYDPQIK